MDKNTKILIGVVAALAVVAVVLVVFLLGLFGGGDAGVTGTIVFRERMALPDDAVARVAIVDTTSGQPLSNQSIQNPGQPPIAFEVPYDESQVNESLMYVVNATIEDGGGNPLFVTRQNFPVITQGNPTNNVQVMVEVPGNAPPAASSFITIEAPQQGAILDISRPVQVSGRGGGLPEGNVVVQALDRDGNVLAEQPTTIDAPDAGTGGQGPWSVQLDIDTEPGMEGLLRAYSPSPADNSVMAEAAINIILGQAEAPGPPTAQISGPTQGETGEPLSFDGSASSGENAIVEYIWDFGDGSGATGPQVDQVYNEPGNYTVSLTVTDDEGLQGSSSLAVQIYPVVEAPDLTDLEGKDWVLVEAATFDVEPITALFQNGTVSGFSGCNTYTGSYQSDGSSLTISDITTTQLACDEDSTTRENSYLADLGSVNGYVVQRKQLTLTGTQPMTFMEQ